MNINTNANNRLQKDDSYFDINSDHANNRNGYDRKQSSIGVRTFLFASVSSSMWWLCTCLYLVQSIQLSVAFQGYRFFTHGIPRSSFYTGLKGTGNPHEYSHHIFQTQARSLSTRGIDPFPDLKQRSFIHTRGFARMSMKLKSSNDGTDDIDRYRGTVQKRQTAIFDGAEFISIASVLKLEAESRLNESEIINEDSDSDDNVSDIIENQLIDEDVPSKMAGCMTFIVANLNSGGRVLGIQTNGNLEIDTNADVKNRGPSMPVVKIEENVYVQKDSIVSIPKGVSDSDAISTAVAALAGVRCSFPTNLNILEDDGDEDSEDSNGNESTGKEQKDFSKSDIVRAVVLGGGDYACFVATAMDSLGADVSLVTTRPMSLKDTPLNPLRNSNGAYNVNGMRVFVQNNCT